MGWDQCIDVNFAQDPALRAPHHCVRTAGHMIYTQKAKRWLQPKPKTYESGMQLYRGLFDVSAHNGKIFRRTRFFVVFELIFLRRGTQQI